MKKNAWRRPNRASSRRFDSARLLQPPVGWCWSDSRNPGSYFAWGALSAAFFAAFEVFDLAVLPFFLVLFAASADLPLGDPAWATTAFFLTCFASAANAAAGTPKRRIRPANRLRFMTAFPFGTPAGNSACDRWDGHRSHAFKWAPDTPTLSADPQKYFETPSRGGRTRTACRAAQRKDAACVRVLTTAYFIVSFLGAFFGAFFFFLLVVGLVVSAWARRIC